MTTLPDVDLRSMLSMMSPDAMAAQIQASIDAGIAEQNRLAEQHAARVTAPSVIESLPEGAAGVMHAASLLSWLALARRAGVPHVEADLVATLPIDAVWAWMDERLAVDDPVLAEFAKAVAHSEAGGYWRTDLCASGWTKHQLSDTGRFDVETFFSLDDPRIMDMHHGLPEILVLGRPLLTPVRVEGWPVEFRVFVGGEAREDGAIAWYYPQSPAFEPTPELVAAAEQARAWALELTTLRERLCLLPCLPGREPDAAIGATIDFMLTEERGLVLIDAGPGYGHGAHPCTFIDSPVEGVRWRLADGVEPR